MKRFGLLWVLLAGVFALAAGAQHELLVHRASGTFEVTMTPVAGGPEDGIGRMSMQKTIHGGMEGASKGEMLSGGDYKTGSAGYVAMETFTGMLNGRSGSFMLQQAATMDAGRQEMKAVVVPGSGTGELKGITGTLTITVDKGQHFYSLEYSLAK